MLMLIVYALIAVGVSFLCSVLEAVLLSIPPSYVAMRAVDGTHTGRRLAALKRDVDRPLAAILTLNTFAHTIGAAGVGAEAAQIWDNNVLGIVSAVMTLVILIASEIIPKTIGAVYWKRLVGTSVSTLQVLIVGLWPLVWVCGLITRLLRSDEQKAVLGRGDFRNLADAGHRFGVLRRDERIIISNLLRFDSVRVGDIMTPREKIVALRADRTIKAVNPRSPVWWTSRIPIYDGELDTSIGYVFKEDVLAARIEKRTELRLRDLRRPLIEVRAADSLQACYTLMAGKRAHIALVRDTQGRTAGIVTMEDIMETMLGMEIDDEDEPPDTGGAMPGPEERDPELQFRNRPDRAPGDEPAADEDGETIS